MVKLPTLYKQDSRGGIRVWETWSQGRAFYVSHGLLDGRKVVDATVCKPKNVGKANETTEEEQARAESLSRWVKQKERERYTESPDGVTEDAFLAPMLARDYTKVGHQLDWNGSVFSQPKYDGVRSIYDFTKQTLGSRKGVPVTSVVNVLEELKDLKSKFHIDGELYLHGMPLNQIVSAVKRRNDNTDKLEFHIFDLAKEGGFSQRAEELDNLGQRIQAAGYKHLKVVDTLHIFKDELQAFHDRFVSEGYEGLILREGDSPYGFGQRSKGLMKYKNFLESEYVIVDVVPDVHGRQGILQCMAANGKTFGARSRGRDEYREWLLDNKDKVVGKLATVRYFALTEFGIPQFPVAVAIGDDK